jgi:hypothetical protein
MAPVQPPPPNQPPPPGTVGYGNAADITAAWPPSQVVLGAAVSMYFVQWFFGQPGQGVAVGPALEVQPQSPDPQQYTCNYSQANSLIPLQPGTYYFTVSAYSAAASAFTSVTTSNPVLVQPPPGPAPQAPAVATATLVPPVPPS